MVQNNQEQWSAQRKSKNARNEGYKSKKTAKVSSDKKGLDCIYFVIVKMGQVKALDEWEANANRS